MLVGSFIVATFWEGPVEGIPLARAPAVVWRILLVVISSMLAGLTGYVDCVAIGTTYNLSYSLRTKSQQ